MKILKILCLIVILIFLENKVYAKYVYEFEETVVKLTRDSSAPICQVKYSEDNITNKDVTITINSNKEIEQASGFELSEDKKILTKKVQKNESGIVSVRDMSGNYSDIEYEVDNIDKELPKLIGCENGGTYLSPVNLEYTDNMEVDEVIVDKYSDKLKLSFFEYYNDSYLYRGIDRTDTTLTINVTEHPINTKKYRYYINDKLYTTIHDTKYIFTNLQKGTIYEIKVEALDELGNVLSVEKIYGKTSFFDTIIGNKTTEKFEATFEGIDKKVSKIKYAVWNCNNEKDIKWNDAIIKDNQTKIELKKENNEFYQAYNIHAYLYDENNNIIDVIAFLVDFGTDYEEKESQFDINQLTEVGDYQISVKDTAGNEVIYYIKVK